MELILGVIVVLFLAILGVLAFLEVDLAWAVVISAMVTVGLCAFASIRFGWAPNPAEAVRTMNLAPLVGGIALIAALAYGLRRFVIARKAKKDGKRTTG